MSICLFKPSIAHRLLIFIFEAAKHKLWFASDDDDDVDGETVQKICRKCKKCFGTHFFWNWPSVLFALFIRSRVFTPNQCEKVNLYPVSGTGIQSSFFAFWLAMWIFFKNWTFTATFSVYFRLFKMLQFKFKFKLTLYLLLIDEGSYWANC